MKWAGRDAADTHGYAVDMYYAYGILHKAGKGQGLEISALHLRLRLRGGAVETVVAAQKFRTS